MKSRCLWTIVRVKCIAIWASGLFVQTFAETNSNTSLDVDLEKRLHRITRERLFIGNLKPWVTDVLGQQHFSTGADVRSPFLITQDDAEPPTLGMEFCKARVYWVLGQSQDAIEVLNFVVGNFGEEKAPGMQMPAPLLAKLWIGTLHRWNGRRAEAIKVYKELVARRWSEQIEEFVIPVCRLYLRGLVNESALHDPQNPAVTDLQVQKEILGKDRELSRMFYGELGQLVDDPTRPASLNVRRTDLERGFRPGSLQLLMVHHLMLIGVLSDPIPGFEDIAGVREAFLEMARRSGDSVDRELASHLLGKIAVATGEWAKAESIYNELFWCGTLRLPESGVSLARCQALKGDPESAARTLDEVVQSFPNQAFEVFKLRKQILP